MLDDVETIEQWYLLPKIIIFMLGIISTMKQFEKSTNQEVWETVRRDFKNSEKGIYG